MHDWYPSWMIGTQLGLCDVTAAELAIFGAVLLRRQRILSASIPLGRRLASNKGLASPSD